MERGMKGEGGGPVEREYESLSLLGRRSATCTIGAIVNPVDANPTPGAVAIALAV